jgi:chorismate-pyruvate lyase
MSKLQPLGALISRYEIPDLRDKLLIGEVRSEQIASALGLDKDHRMWARTYRIRAGRALTTGILEIFSPALFENREGLA